MSFDNMSSFLNAAMEAPETKLRRGIDSVLDKTHEYWLRNTEEVRASFGTTYSVDEMALLFPNRGLLAVFLSLAVQREWVLFNYSEDSVITRPIPGSYVVEYWFMRHPDIDYRLELMTIQEGFSPYHSSLMESMNYAGSPVSLVHASFKALTEEYYGSAIVGLRKAGYELAQHCESSYGRFSYFLQDDSPIALKPRVNLRDTPRGGGNSGH